MLFQGGGNQQSSVEYNAKQKKLLQTELARQGFSPRMAGTILGNFDCYKSEIKDDSISESIRARRVCAKNPIIMLENFTLTPTKNRISNSKTTTEYVDNVNRLQKERNIKRNFKS